GANDSFVICRLVNVGMSGISNDQIHALIFSKRRLGDVDGLRAKVETSVVLESLIEQERSQLAGSAADFENPPHTAPTEPVGDDGPEEVIPGLGITAVVNRIASIISIVPTRRAFAPLWRGGR